ncbi:N-acetylmuramoyl-L-alanine amidase [Riemerella columbipharyngis]|uniref:N-acetylmuramoyl-L-alanine amidase n=1 Tax=Riemerella columbipharyngis TaxID=1071918 RepID=A0A1G7FP77_9FLAO|nr:N-acetylmuramoyl-L-alanine amidase [Riemerella columbipharyngis]SDE77686.1 N-acetylmuramoyl-L-alanine amidase [Riemerella columbipharyngis]
MRTIKYIVLHCTATSQITRVETIKKYWKNNLGWKHNGYHYIIKPCGEIVNLTPIEEIANGVKGYNQNSIHISYIGGIDKTGKPQDNRTLPQKASQVQLLRELKKRFPNAEILGHRDFAGVHKACPSFDVKQWLKSIEF